MNKKLPAKPKGRPLLRLFVNEIINLMKVKSLITLAIIGALVFLTINRMIEPATFMTVVGSVITYYFTRKEGKQK